MLAAEYTTVLDPAAPLMWKLREDVDMRGEVLPKAFIKKTIDTVMYEQAHRFVLMNHPLLEQWRTKYMEANMEDNDLPSLQDWIRPAVVKMLEHRHVGQDVLDISVGPSHYARFYAGMWSQWRHFRVLSRDSKVKTTADSYISAYFDVGTPEKQEFVGQIEHIIVLDYDSVKVTLFRGLWYNNNATVRRKSTTLVEDECGFLRVYAKEFMSSHLLKHEPYVLPKDCNQVFMVEDRLRKHWKIVVDTEVRKTRVYKNNVPVDDVRVHTPPLVCMPNEGDEVIEIEEDYSSDEEEIGLPGNMIGESSRSREVHMESDEDDVRVYTRRRRAVVNNHTLDTSQEEDLRRDEIEALQMHDGVEGMDDQVEVDAQASNIDYEVVEL